ncbi:plasmid recombination protein [Aerococcaceae bacterium DSM 111176]|nr:plasmid recombination protein [Aerococcaceae bacterium DSM 111176]
MRNKLSINRKKLKRGSSVGNLYKEYTRDESNAEYYDKDGRAIDTTKTGDNVTLVDVFAKFKAQDQVPDDLTFDDFREVQIGIFDKARASRDDGGDSRRLRSDAVDIITNVVQPSAEFINSLSREQQIEFFKDTLQVMVDDKGTWGTPLVASVHFDETTPHMQVMTSTLNHDDQLGASVNKMFGNKTKMSRDQSRFVEQVQAKGWQVERGIQRVDNPHYQNFRDEMTSQGLEVTRLNDEEAFAMFERKREAHTQKEKDLDSREKTLDAREKNLDDRAEKNHHHLKILLTREKKLKEREDSMSESMGFFDNFYADNGGPGGMMGALHLAPQQKVLFAVEKVMQVQNVIKHKEAWIKDKLPRAEKAASVIQKGAQPSKIDLELAREIFDSVIEPTQGTVEQRQKSQSVERELDFDI